MKRTCIHHRSSGSIGVNSYDNEDAPGTGRALVFSRVFEPIWKSVVGSIRVFLDATQSPVSIYVTENKKFRKVEKFTTSERELRNYWYSYHNLETFNEGNRCDEMERMNRLWALEVWPRASRTIPERLIPTAAIPSTFQELDPMVSEPSAAYVFGIREHGNKNTWFVSNGNLRRDRYTLFLVSAVRYASMVLSTNDSTVSMTITM